MSRNSININAAAGDPCPFCSADPGCPLCEGTGIAPDDVHWHVDLAPGATMSRREIATLAAYGVHLKRIDEQRKADTP